MAPVFDAPTYNFHNPPPPERKKRRLHAEIAAFAEAHAGTDFDLDEDLERAGIEAIRNENRP